MELLNAALKKLQEVDEQQADLWPAVGNFTRCQLLFLGSGDTTGFHWSLQILQGLIKRFCRDSETQLHELFKRLLGSFGDAETAGDHGGFESADGGNAESESTEALAAFHTARFTSVVSRDFLQAEELYRTSLASAKTSCLRYEASVGLGVVLLKLGKKEEALASFREARGFAKQDGSSSSDSFTIASYWAARACVLLGDIPQAMETMLEAGEGHLVSALVMALYAEMISSPVEDVVRRCTVARTHLTRLMPDLTKMFAGYFPPEFLLKYLNLDQFSAFFILEASKFPLEVSEPVQRSFFVFELACDLRRKLIEIQQQQQSPVIQLYMDPKPHLEEGIHLFVTKSFKEALAELVTCHQIAAVTGDLTCFDLVSDHIYTCIQLLRDSLSQPEIHSHLLASFKRAASDGEDPEAWTLFFIGKSGIDEGGRTILEEKHQLLEQALEISQTTLLRYHACEILGQLPGELDLDYLEQMVAQAQVIGKPELIISSLHTLFQVALLRHWRVDTAMSSVKRMLSASRSSSWHENPRALALALVLQMRGLVHQYLLDYKLGEEFLNRASEIAKLLPRYPPLARLHFYLAGREAPGWSYGLNFIAHLDMFYPRNQPPLPEYSFMKGKAGAYESHQSINDLRAMISQGHLDEAERRAGELLHSLKLSTADARYFQQAHVTMLLAQLVCARHKKRASNDEIQLRTTLRMIQELADESLELGIKSGTLVPDYGFARWVHAQHCILLDELGESFASLRKLEVVVRLECLEMDACFGRESWARIRRVDNLQSFFKTLHSRLWDFDELQQALVWGERERARDFLYTLERDTHREQYMQEFNDFDSDFHKAWSEIRSICEMMRGEAVFIIISQRRLTDELQVLFLDPQAELIGRRYQRFTPVSELVRSIVTSSPEAWKLLGEYYEMLVKPFTPELDRIQPRRIIFIPSEEMCLVPFAALFDWESKRYLIQSYSLATAPSLRFFKQCQLRSLELDHQVLEDHHPALVLGNPTSDLGFAEIEATVVEEALNQVGFQVTRLDGSQVSKKLVLESLPESCWVHAACHATVDENYPHGALLLAPGEDEPDHASGSREAGLTADEIAGAPALRASAVVLSACSSGQGALHAEGVLGLPRFLHSRGVPAVVFSLWTVDDFATELLMEGMYKHLEAGSEIAESLRSASLELLDDEFGPACDIKHWGAFGVSGCPSVRLQPAYLRTTRVMPVDQQVSDMKHSAAR